MPLLGTHSSWCRKGWKGVCVEECVSLERPTALLRSQRPHPPGCPASQRWLPPGGGHTSPPQEHTCRTYALHTHTRVLLPLTQSMHTQPELTEARATHVRTRRRARRLTLRHPALGQQSRAGLPGAPGGVGPVSLVGSGLYPDPEQPRLPPQAGARLPVPPPTVRAAWSSMFVTVPKAPVPTGEAPSGAWPLPAVALTGHPCELSACCALGPERPERGLDTHTLPGMHDHVTRRRDGHDAPRSPSPAAPASV